MLLGEWTNSVSARAAVPGTGCARWQVPHSEELGAAGWSLSSRAWQLLHELAALVTS